MAHRELLTYRDGRRLRGIAFRGALLVLVFGAGFAGFLLGADVSDRPGVPESGVGVKLYYTIGLFVLGGLDLGVPTGEPWYARALLWFAYFGAPIITASAVIEGVVRLVDPERWRLRGLRNHIVIGGCGRLSMLYLRRLRERHNRAQVVVIDTDANHPYRLSAEAMRARFVRANISANNLITSLNLRRARRVFLFTGDDFANLDAAARMLAEAPELRDRMVVHVADLRFKRLMASTSVAQHAHVFNLYQAAAEHLVETELLPYFERTEFRDILVFAGFGRLGQTILDELQRRAPETLAAIIIVDTDAAEREAVFEEQCGFSDTYERHVIDGDANGVRVWRQVEELYDFRERTPAFLLVSGSDALNLRLALRLSQRFPGALAVARTYFRSSFADEVSREGGFRTFSVADEILASMPDAWLS